MTHFVSLQPKCRRALPAILAAALLSFPLAAGAHGQQGGQGMMGEGQMMQDGEHRGPSYHGGNEQHYEMMQGGNPMMGGHMMGSCMMGGDMMGGHMMTRGGEPRVFTLEEIETLASAHLILLGNPRLKVGGVSEGEDDQAIVEIVTQDGSLVDRLAVDRRDLHHWRIE